jgi:hypothetical protein
MERKTNRFSQQTARTMELEKTPQRELQRSDVKKQLVKPKLENRSTLKCSNVKLKNKRKHNSVTLTQLLEKPTALKT